MAKAAATLADVKSGLTSSEFSVSSISALVVVIMEVTRTPPKDVYDAAVRIAVVLTIGAIVVSYNQSRGRVKSSANEAKAAVASANVANQ